MSQKRTRLEIINDILKVIGNRSGRIKPTHVMYKSNLSYRMMEIYLRELKEKGLIEVLIINESRTFIITSKGHSFLNQYSQVVQGFITHFELSVNQARLSDSNVNSP